jgi:homoserine O-acetyltransferase/O-succinyltransferase
MKAIVRIVFSLILLTALLVPEAGWAQDTLRIADLGDFRLENGQVIRDCRLGYRTFGTLNKDGSNAILFPTWLAGSSEDLVSLGFIGPSRLADTSRYYVIAVDAFGNGVSASPSTSVKQPGRSFPEFSIRDMVHAQHRLLTRHLHLHRLYAVMGISMGGMQAFQWVISYPQFAQKAVSIMGSPRPTSNDMLVFNAELRAIEAAGAIDDGDAWGFRTLAALQAIVTRTPEYYLRHTPQADVPSLLADMEKALMKYNLTDWAWQLKAILGHNIFNPPVASEAGAAKAIRAKLLVVVSRNDLLVNPEPSLALAAALKSKALVLRGDCGHFSFLCEADQINTAVSSFLSPQLPQ